MNGKDIKMRSSKEEKGSKHYYDYLHSSKLNVPLFEEKSTGIKTKLAAPEQVETLEPKINKSGRTTFM